MHPVVVEVDGSEPHVVDSTRSRSNLTNVRIPLRVGHLAVDDAHRSTGAMRPDPRRDRNLVTFTQCVHHSSNSRKIEPAASQPMKPTMRPRLNRNHRCPLINGRYRPVLGELAQANDAAATVVSGHQPWQITGANQSRRARRTLWHLRLCSRQGDDSHVCIVTGSRLGHGRHHTICKPVADRGTGLRPSRPVLDVVPVGRALTDVRHLVGR